MMNERPRFFLVVVVLVVVVVVVAVAVAVAVVVVVVVGSLKVVEWISWKFFCCFFD